MITKFTTTNGSSTSSGGNSNTILYLVIGAMALYLAYNYLIKPQKQKEQETKPEQ